LSAWILARVEAVLPCALVLALRGTQCGETLVAFASGSSCERGRGEGGCVEERERVVEVPDGFSVLCSDLLRPSVIDHGGAIPTGVPRVALL